MFGCCVAGRRHEGRLVVNPSPNFQQAVRKALPFSVLRSHAGRRLSSGHCMKTRQRTLPVLLLNRERWSHRHNHSMRASLRSLALSVAFASLGPFPHISALWRPSCPSGLWFEVALHESERECLTDEAMKQ